MGSLANAWVRCGLQSARLELSVLSDLVRVCLAFCPLVFASLAPVVRRSSLSLSLSLSSSRLRRGSVPDSEVRETRHTTSTFLPYTYSRDTEAGLYLPEFWSQSSRDPPSGITEILRRWYKVPGKCCLPDSHKVSQPQQHVGHLSQPVICPLFVPCLIDFALYIGIPYLREVREHSYHATI